MEREGREGETNPLKGKVSLLIVKVEELTKLWVVESVEFRTKDNDRELNEIVVCCVGKLFPERIRRISSCPLIHFTSPFCQTLFSSSSPLIWELLSKERRRRLEEEEETNILPDGGHRNRAVIGKKKLVNRVSELIHCFGSSFKQNKAEGEFFVVSIGHKRDEKR